MSTNVRKLCHISSVHNPFDTRIFYKECTTLANAKYDVTFIVQYHCDEERQGVKIKGIHKAINRFERFTKTLREAYKRSLECDADIYHFHDPELIPLGIYLKRQGKKVIYDVHEDLPQDINYKPWIPAYLRPLLSKIAEKVEAFAAKRFDAVITATPYIAQRFKKHSNFVVDIKNYPLIKNDIPPVTWSKKERNICYISSNFIFVRAIREVVQAMQLVEGTLTLAGNLKNEVLKEELSSELGWKQVTLLGWVSRRQVVEIMAKSIAGLSLYYPTKTNYYAIPTKMFEYMMAGIPVIASNLPYETEIINKYKCGICVDPLSPKQIADAINWLMDNPKEAEQMGLNGRTAVENEFNWKTEEIKLLSLYKELLG